MNELNTYLLKIAVTLILGLTILTVVALPFVVYRVWKSARKMSQEQDKEVQELKQRNAEFRRSIGLR